MVTVNLMKVEWKSRNEETSSRSNFAGADHAKKEDPIHGTVRLYAISRLDTGDAPRAQHPGGGS